MLTLLLGLLRNVFLTPSYYKWSDQWSWPLPDFPLPVLVTCIFYIVSGHIIFISFSATLILALVHSKCTQTLQPIFFFHRFPDNLLVGEQSSTRSFLKKRSQKQHSLNSFVCKTIRGLQSWVVIQLGVNPGGNAFSLEHHLGLHPQLLALGAARERPGFCSL